MNTYPNQKIIHINKRKYTANFLQVGIDEWENAYKELKPSTFGIYLYLASNADGFDLALSQKAIENVLGIKKTAYHNAIAELESKGYITLIQGNIQSFFTTPVRKNALRKNELQSSQKRTSQSANADIKSAKTNYEVRENDIEIDNINKIYNINKINNDIELDSSESVKEEIEEEQIEMDNIVEFKKVTKLPDKLVFIDEVEEENYNFIKNALYYHNGRSKAEAALEAWNDILTEREFYQKQAMED